LIFLNSSIPQLFTFPFIAKSLLHKTQDGLSSQLPFASLTRKLQFRHFIVILFFPRVLFYFNFQFFYTSRICTLRRQVNHGPKKFAKDFSLYPNFARLHGQKSVFSRNRSSILLYKNNQLIYRYEIHIMYSFR